MQPSNTGNLMLRILPYPAALSALKKYGKLGSKPGLSRIKKLLSILGNPQNDCKTIIVAGTNGKGSTAAMLASILSASGCITGSYFSPHIFDFRERILLDGKKITKKDFSISLSAALHAAASKPFARDAPSFFEIATAAALHYFAKKNCEWAVLEAGMGGRLDATNACNAALSCITSISLDHTKWLGSTLRKIAFEKACVAKKGKPLVCAHALPLPAKKEIKKICMQKGAKLVFPSSIDNSLAKSARLRLAGGFQISNAAVAACAARLLGMKKSAIISGLASACLPGRMQILSRKPFLLIDSAHNPEASKMLANSLPFALPKNSHPRILLFSSMSDKDYKPSLRHLAQIFDFVVLFSLPLARAEKTGKLSEAAILAGFPKNAVFSAPSPRRSLSLAKKLAGKKGAVVACGSMYSFQYLFCTHQFGLPQ